MSKQYSFEIDFQGKILNQGRPITKNMAVNYSQTWCIHAKSPEALCKGLALLGKQYRFVRPTNVKADLNIWIKKWDMKNRPNRPPVIGISAIPGYGLAKRLSNINNHTWGLLINLEDKNSTKNGTVGWKHIEDTEKNSALYKFFDFSYVSLMAQMAINNITKDSW